MPISGKEMRKLFQKAGYEVVSGAGKGSHWKLKKKSAPKGPSDIRALIYSKETFFWTLLD